MILLGLINLLWTRWSATEMAKQVVLRLRELAPTAWRQDHATEEKLFCHSRVCSPGKDDVFETCASQVHGKSLFLIPNLRLSLYFTFLQIRWARHSSLSLNSLDKATLFLFVWLHYRARNVTQLPSCIPSFSENPFSRRKWSFHAFRPPGIQSLTPYLNPS